MFEEDGHPQSKHDLRFPVEVAEGLVIGVARLQECQEWEEVAYCCAY